MINLPAVASSIFVNVKPSLLRSGNRRRRQTDFVCYPPTVIGEVELRTIHAVELPQHPDEIGLSAKQFSDDNSRALAQRRPAQIFTGEHALAFHKFLVKFRERQLGRQHRVLDVEQPVVAGRKTTRFGMPGFRAGIRRINADINDLGNFQAPVAHDLEAFAVPRGIGNDVDCNIYVERAGILECFKIFGECDALSVTLQPLLVDCFKTEEHGIQAESLPKFEDLLVAQEHIAARFEIVTFPDSAAGDRFAKLHTVLGLNEGYVVHDKNSRLADLCQFFDRALWCLHAVVATVERPRTAEDTVPWTAPAKLDGSSRIELAYKIFPAMSNDIARRQEIIQRFHEGWRRPAMIEC